MQAAWTGWQALPAPTTTVNVLGREVAFAVGEGLGNTIGAYITGPPQVKAIIFLPDHFGWRVPQLQALCDALSQACDALVCCPDVHRGNCIDRYTAEAVRFAAMPRFDGTMPLRQHQLDACAAVLYKMLLTSSNGLARCAAMLQPQH